ncbi:hypothetical protein [Herbidospora sp. NBRC 101105]|uniref:hypothetical protein n=1 Tax=Herbidospora sp. NBRC 101105 TaxID=3032195 RepID=UPI0024A51A10|nr:hypothetical protein [Herbidospora sp. NBRC 101105]GLX96042.1 membrane protein [Herbidospora sp. NBRC 101105]
MKRLIPAVVLATLIGMFFVGSFVGALHSPEPHDVPVAVVGPPQAAAQLAPKLAGKFELTAYADEAAARTALADREVDAVLLPQQQKLVVASAASRSAATVITSVFTAAAPLAVEDAHPLPPGDQGGIAGMFFVIGLVIPGIAIGVAAAGERPLAGIGAIVLAGVAVGLANAWLGDVVFGALPGAFLGLVAVSAAVVVTLGLVVAGLVRLIGTPGAGLAGLLFVLIGVPASGGPLGARFIPEWYAAVGQVLPVGQGSTAIRNVVFFDGAALGLPLLVLAGWAVVGLTLTLSALSQVKRASFAG